MSRFLIFILFFQANELLAKSSSVLQDCGELEKVYGVFLTPKINKACHGDFTVDVERAQQEWIELKQSELYLYEQVLVEALGEKSLKIERYFEDKSILYQAHIIQRTVNYDGYFYALKRELERLFKEQCLNITSLFGQQKLEIYRGAQVKSKSCEKWKNFLSRKKQRLEAIVFRIEEELGRNPNRREELSVSLRPILKNKEKFFQIGSLISEKGLKKLVNRSVEFVRGETRNRRSIGHSAYHSAQ